MQEDNTVVEIKGLSALAYAVIPWVLAIGATAILSFIVYAYAVHKDWALEKRFASYVGADTKPVAPIKIVVENSGGIKVEHADWEPGRLLVRYHNVSGSKVDFIQIHYRFKGPDGTVMTSGSEYAELNGGSSYLLPGETGQVIITTKNDSNATALSILVE